MSDTISFLLAAQLLARPCDSLLQAERISFAYIIDSNRKKYKKKGIPTARRVFLFSECLSFIRKADV